MGTSISKSFNNASKKINQRELIKRCNFYIDTGMMHNILLGTEKQILFRIGLI